MQKNEGPGDIEAIKQLLREIEYILEQEDVRWNNWGKQNWYMNGDQNTPFFHAWATHRRKINHIKKIEDEEGREWGKPEEVRKAFIDFYQQLFTTEDVVRVDQCLNGLETRVTAEMNANLMKEFTPAKVEKALALMHPLKSSGPDGFATCFYKRSWDTVHVEVCTAVLDFLNHGMFVNSINDTYIVLIPKIKNPSRITEYCPISLCNELYKLIAKVLANILKQILPDIISPSQSAFTPRHLITDNILVAFEALHTMDTRKTRRKGYMALKLDMSKAYDRMEWDFLEAIMRKLGFSDRWVQLLMTFVRTVSYSILINGQPFGKIHPSGDSLSPYFFIVCAEGLSHLLNWAEQDGQITRLPITRGGMKINHLFFANDGLLFCRANMEEWIRVHEILAVYEQASGKKLNRGKTSIFFSRNTNQAVRELITSTASICNTTSYEKYLGLPPFSGRSRVSSFTGIKGKIWERINGWKEKFLSQAGKEVLLKAVIQAIPNYTMSVF